MIITQELLEGMEARSEGVAITSNPHQDASAREQWRIGYETMDARISGVLKDAKSMLDGFSEIRRQRRMLHSRVLQTV